MHGQLDGQRVAPGVGDHDEAVLGPEVELVPELVPHAVEHLVDAKRRLAHDLRLDVAARTAADLQRVGMAVARTERTDDATALDGVGHDEAGLMDLLVLSLGHLGQAADDLGFEAFSGLVHSSAFISSIGMRDPMQRACRPRRWPQASCRH